MGVPRRPHGISALGALALPVLACATGGAVPSVDLTRARAAVEEARKAGAAERAAETLARAEQDLKQAESLAAGPASRRPEAQRASDRAEVQALCATSLARLSSTAEARVAAAAGASPETERLSGRLKRAEEGQRRLEERLAVLTRELELTETELIRSKARMQGNETKAEASAAIAEARILASRLPDRSRSSAYARTQDSLAKAEEQLVAGNFGAAIFFAQKAQDTIGKAQETAEVRPEAATGLDRPPTQPTYVARATVNIRKGPAASEPVLGKAPAGATLAASARRGDWVKVIYNGVTGWAHASLLR